MKNTTLVYIEQDEKYLMLLRNKKKNDENKGKWIGVGGKFEDGESPVDCMKREVLEETGLTVNDFRFRGIVTFVSNEYGTEYMFLFTAKGFEGEIKECDEGELRWIPKTEVMDLNLWAGDRHFLKLLSEDAPFFLMTLRYEGETLVEATTQYDII